MGHQDPDPQPLSIAERLADAESRCDTLECEVSRRNAALIDVYDNLNELRIQLGLQPVQNPLTL